VSTVDDDDDFDAMLDDDLDDDTDGGDEDPSYMDGLSAPARQLAIRRALEERSEARAMNASLDYLDLDFDDED
jgi:hypothetical protein